jgi:predicted amidophosphoribosyltransferase
MTIANPVEAVGEAMKPSLLERLMRRLFGDPSKCRDCGKHLPERNVLCDACALEGQI